MMTATATPITDGGKTQTRHRDADRFKGGFGRGAFRAERAAAYCDVSRDTFDRWNAAGKVPRPVRIGGVNLWPRVDLDGWIAAGMPDRSAWEAIRGANRAA
jgi:predicted DNA-binding transcriptional regulator AlpA